MQKENQASTKHHIHNYRSSNTKPLSDPTVLNLEMFGNARRRKSKNRQYSGKKKGNDVNIYKSLQRMLQIEHHQHNYKPRVELWKW